MAHIIDKDKINDFVQSLRKKKTVFAPQKNGDEISFKKVGSKSEVVLGYKKTSMSVKEYFLPSREITFTLDNKTKKITTAKSPESFIVFGLNKKDLEALSLLDQIMKNPQEDYFYFQKRKKSIVIGLVNESILAVPGGDLVLEKINEKQYRAVAVTSKGKNLLKSKLFKKVQIPKIKQYPAKPSKFKEMLLDSELLAEAVEWSWENDKTIWNDLAKTCLGCGICTYVCPLCYCFSFEDRVSLDGKSCSRCRNWDACTLPGFSQVAGGHNFHATLKERYYNWFYHKFVRGYKEHGRALCVACGRCKQYCPAGISIKKVLSQILKDYLRANK